MYNQYTPSKANSPHPRDSNVAICTSRVLDLPLLTLCGLGSLGMCPGLADIFIEGRLISPPSPSSFLINEPKASPSASSSTSATTATAGHNNNSISNFSHTSVSAPARRNPRSPNTTSNTATGGEGASVRFNQSRDHDRTLGSVLGHSPFALGGRLVWREDEGWVPSTRGLTASSSSVYNSSSNSASTQNFPDEASSRALPSLFSSSSWRPSSPTVSTCPTPSPLPLPSLASTPSAMLAISQYLRCRSERIPSQNTEYRRSALCYEVMAEIVDAAICGAVHSAKEEEQGPRHRARSACEPTLTVDLFISEFAPSLTRSCRSVGCACAPTTKRNDNDVVKESGTEGLGQLLPTWAQLLLLLTDSSPRTEEGSTCKETVAYATPPLLAILHTMATNRRYRRHLCLILDELVESVCGSCKRLNIKGTATAAPMSSPSSPLAPVVAAYTSHQKADTTSGDCLLLSQVESEASPSHTAKGSSASTDSTARATRGQLASFCRSTVSFILTHSIAFLLSSQEACGVAKVSNTRHSRYRQRRRRHLSARRPTSAFNPFSEEREALPLSGSDARSRPRIEEQKAAGPEHVETCGVAFSLSALRRLASASATRGFAMSVLVGDGHCGEVYTKDHPIQWDDALRGGLHAAYGSDGGALVPISLMLLSHLSRVSANSQDGSSRSSGVNSLGSFRPYNCNSNNSSNNHSLETVKRINATLQSVRRTLLPMASASDYYSCASTSTAAAAGLGVGPEPSSLCAHTVCDVVDVLTAKVASRPNTSNNDDCGLSFVLPVAGLRECTRLEMDGGGLLEIDVAVSVSACTLSDAISPKEKSSGPLPSQPTVRGNTLTKQDGIHARPQVDDGGSWVVPVSIRQEVNVSSAISNNDPTPMNASSACASPPLLLLTVDSTTGIASLPKKHTLAGLENDIQTKESPKVRGRRGMVGLNIKVFRPQFIPHTCTVVGELQSSESDHSPFEPKVSSVRIAVRQRITVPSYRPAHQSSYRLVAFAEELLTEMFLKCCKQFLSPRLYVATRPSLISNEMEPIIIKGIRDVVEVGAMHSNSKTEEGRRTPHSYHSSSSRLSSDSDSSSSTRSSDGFGSIPNLGTDMDQPAGIKDSLTVHADALGNGNGSDPVFRFISQHACFGAGLVEGALSASREYGRAHHHHHHHYGDTYTKGLPTRYQAELLEVIEYAFRQYMRAFHKGAGGGTSAFDQQNFTECDDHVPALLEDWYRAYSRVEAAEATKKDNLSPSKKANILSRKGGLGSACSEGVSDDSRGLVSRTVSSQFHVECREGCTSSSAQEGARSASHTSDHSTTHLTDTTKNPLSQPTVSHAHDVHVCTTPDTTSPPRSSRVVGFSDPTNCCNDIHWASDVPLILVSCVLSWHIERSESIVSPWWPQLVRAESDDSLFATVRGSVEKPVAESRPSSLSRTVELRSHTQEILREEVDRQSSMLRGYTEIGWDAGSHCSLPTLGDGGHSSRNSFARGTREASFDFGPMAEEHFRRLYASYVLPYKDTLRRMDIGRLYEWSLFLLREVAPVQRVEGNRLRGPPTALSKSSGGSEASQGWVDAHTRTHDVSSSGEEFMANRAGLANYIVFTTDMQGDKSNLGLPTATVKSSPPSTSRPSLGRARRAFEDHRSLQARPVDAKAYLRLVRCAIPTLTSADKETAARRAIRNRMNDAISEAIFSVLTRPRPPEVTVRSVSRALRRRTQLAREIAALYHAILDVMSTTPRDFDTWANEQSSKFASMLLTLTGFNDGNTDLDVLIEASADEGASVTGGGWDTNYRERLGVKGLTIERTLQEAVTAIARLALETNTVKTLLQPPCRQQTTRGESEVVVSVCSFIAHPWSHSDLVAIGTSNIVGFLARALGVGVTDFEVVSDATEGDESRAIWDTAESSNSPVEGHGHILLMTLHYCIVNALQCLTQETDSIAGDDKRFYSDTGGGTLNGGDVQRFVSDLTAASVAFVRERLAMEFGRDTAQGNCASAVGAPTLSLEVGPDGDGVSEFARLNVLSPEQLEGLMHSWEPERDQILKRAVQTWNAVARSSHAPVEARQHAIQGCVKLLRRGRIVGYALETLRSVLSCCPPEQLESVLQCAREALGISSILTTSQRTEDDVAARACIERVCKTCHPHQGQGGTYAYVLSEGSPLTPLYLSAKPPSLVSLSTSIVSLGMVVLDLAIKHQLTFGVSTGEGVAVVVSEGAAKLQIVRRYVHPVCGYVHLLGAVEPRAESTRWAENPKIPKSDCNNNNSEGACEVREEQSGTVRKVFLSDLTAEVDWLVPSTPTPLVCGPRENDNADPDVVGLVTQTLEHLACRAVMESALYQRLNVQRSASGVVGVGANVTIASSGLLLDLTATLLASESSIRKHGTVSPQDTKSLISVVRHLSEMFSVNRQNSASDNDEDNSSSYLVVCEGQEQLSTSTIRDPNTLFAAVSSSMQRDRGTGGRILRGSSIATSSGHTASVAAWQGGSTADKRYRSLVTELWSQINEESYAHVSPQDKEEGETTCGEIIVEGGGDTLDTQGFPLVLIPREPTLVEILRSQSYVAGQGARSNFYAPASTGNEYGEESPKHVTVSMGTYVTDLICRDVSCCAQRGRGGEYVAPSSADVCMIGEARRDFYEKCLAFVRRPSTEAPASAADSRRPSSPGKSSHLGGFENTSSPTTCSGGGNLFALSSSAMTLLRLLRSAVVALATALFEVEDVTDIDVICLAHNRKTSTTTSSLVRTVAATITVERLREALTLLSAAPRGLLFGDANEMKQRLPTQPAIVALTVTRASFHRMPHLFTSPSAPPEGEEDGGEGGVSCAASRLVAGLVAMLCRICSNADTSPVVVNAAMITLCEIFELDKVRLPPTNVLNAMLAPLGLFERDTHFDSSSVSQTSAPRVNSIYYSNLRITQPFTLRLCVAHYLTCKRKGKPVDWLCFHLRPSTTISGMDSRELQISFVAVSIALEACAALETVNFLPESVAVCGGSPIAVSLWEEAAKAFELRPKIREHAKQQVERVLGGVPPFVERFFLEVVHIEKEGSSAPKYTQAKRDHSLTNIVLENGAVFFAAQALLGNHHTTGGEVASATLHTHISPHESAFFNELVTLLDRRPMLADPLRYLVPSSKLPLIVPTHLIRGLPLVLSELASYSTATATATATAAVGTSGGASEKKGCSSSIMSSLLSKPMMIITPLRPYLLHARGLSVLAESVAGLLVSLDRPNAGPNLLRVWPLLEMAGEVFRERSFERVRVSVLGDREEGSSEELREGLQQARGVSSSRARQPLVAPTVRGIDVTVFYSNNASSSLSYVLSRTVFRQLYERLFSAPLGIWCMAQPFYSKLEGQQSAAIDQGGVCRDVLSNVGVEIMTPHVGSGGSFMMNPLFVRCGGSGQGAGGDLGILVTPAPLNEESDPTHKSMLVFLGRLIGHFLLSDNILPVDFPVFFWYVLLYKVSRPELLRDVCPGALSIASPRQLEDCFDILEDFEDVFPNLAARGQQLIKEHEERLLESEATVESVASSSSSSSSTCKGSLLCGVFEQLSQECISRLVDAYSRPISFVREGLLQVFSSSPHMQTRAASGGGQEVHEVRREAEKLLQSLIVPDVIRRVCGQAFISTADLKAVVSHTMPTSMTEIFWAAIDRLTSSQRGQFLQFGTGQRRLPLPDGEKLTIVALLPPGSLPTAHTCTMTIQLPSSFEDVDNVYSSLLLAINSEFAFA